MLIRKVMTGEGSALLELMATLDEETTFMMLEPGERQTTAEDQNKVIESFDSSTSKVMFVADTGEELAGFVAGVGKTANRNKHSMYCVIGIRQNASGQGVGTRLMIELEAWAREHGFTRLELTVMVHNEPAKRLYLGRGFVAEGTKKNSLVIDGEYVDELYMAKVW